MHFDPELMVFAVVLMLFAVAAVSVVWTTLRTGSPPMPSSASVRRAIVAAIQTETEGGGAEILDIGSGWGGLARRLAIAFPGARVIGLDLALLPHFIAQIASKIIGPSNLSFRRGDARSAELRNVDVVTLYLSGPTLLSIWPEVENGLTPGTLVVSAAFALPGRDALRIETAGDWLSTPIYIYRDGGLRL